MTFAEQLKKAQEDRGETQQEMADFLGISKSSLCKWQAGDGEPSQVKMDGILSRLGVEGAAPIASVVRCPKCLTTFHPVPPSE